MSPGVQVQKNRIIGKATVRHYSVWLLGALLLLFSANARLSRYGLQHHDLKLTTAQSYLGDETRLQLSIAALLLLWSVAATSVLPFVATRRSFAVTAISGSSHSHEFDPESHLRPPPLR